MTTVPPTLDSLRGEIDRIDDAVHDLILRRAEIVREIGRTKASASAPMLRPAREAQLIRRLARRHQGPMPLGVVVRLWRELITGGSLGLQEAFSVAVLAGDKASRSRELARDHYGGSVPIRPSESAEAVIAHVRAGRASVGVLPLDPEGDPDPWWRRLAASNADSPHVIVKLPFLAEPPGGAAYVLAKMPHEPSGDDLTLLAFAGKDAGAARERLAAAGFAARLVARSGGWHLAELGGFIAEDDKRLGSIGDAVIIGGYATPLTSQ